MAILAGFLMCICFVLADFFHNAGSDVAMAVCLTLGIVLHVTSLILAFKHI